MNIKPASFLPFSTLISITLEQCEEVFSQNLNSRCLSLKIDKIKSFFKVLFKIFFVKLIQIFTEFR